MLVTQAPPGTKKILIVDDESAIFQTLRFNLERNGYVVATAGDGRSRRGASRERAPRPDRHGHHAARARRDRSVP
jgi:CheY-like chemotaxis protein